MCFNVHGSILNHWTVEWRPGENSFELWKKETPSSHTFLFCHFSYLPSSLLIHFSFLKYSCGPSTSFPLGPCLRKMNEPHLMYNPAGKSAAKKSLTLLDESPKDCGPLNRECQPFAAPCRRGRGLVIIIPKSAMASKNDVHLSVIYSTRPVSTDKVNLACQPPLRASGLLSWPLQNPKWLDKVSCHQLSLHL